MYCDFCGKTLSYNVKYCRYCGRQLKGCSGDTQPLPVIDEVMLNHIQGGTINVAPWYKSIFKRKTRETRSNMWRIMHCLLSLLILVALIYIILTFTTIKQYQILIGVVGSLFASYIWWRG
jgi:hypothetical protein